MKSEISLPVTDVLLTTKELAMRWHMDPQVLINQRSNGRGPRYIHIGRTGKGKRPAVRYRLSTIIAFEREQQTHG